MFLLFIKKITKWLINEAQSYINKLLEKILTTNLNLNKYIFEKFDKIIKRLVTVTETPDECVDLIKFYENVKMVELFNLKVGQECFFILRINLLM